MPLNDQHQSKILERGFDQTHLERLSMQNGRPAVLESLSPEQIQSDWLDRFPSLRGNPGGALKLQFNDTTISLKPDQPDWDEEKQRFKKYLYAVRKDQEKPGSNVQPWIPRAPAAIATEGLFDALACTALMHVPCAAATAPSHIRGSHFPDTVKSYVSDSDVPFHHSPSLLPVVVEQCRAKGLKMAHLPRNPNVNYAYIGAHIPEECKWGMEEWARYWIENGFDPTVEIQKVISGALPPVDYLSEIFREHQRLGVCYPDHRPIIENAAKAIPMASRRFHQRRSLRDLLHICTGAPLSWIDDVIQQKLRSVENDEWDPNADEPTEWQIKVDQAKHSGGGDPVAIHDALSELLNERAMGIMESPRPIRSQKAAIRAVAASLGFKPDNRFIDGLFDELDTSIGAYEPDVEPGGIFTARSQAWLLDKLFLVGLNLLVGMPGAGKSRLLVALIRAHLDDQSTFIGRTLQPGSDRHVLLIGTDQDRQQWGALLEEQGLAKVISSQKNADGTETNQYKLHDRITLKTSGGGFKLDADGIRYIRDWNQQHPGGLTICDSFSAVLPVDVKETDENAGRLMRRVEVARQGNSMIVTHHSSKNAAHEGELGVYSGSGHGSIDRAVSRFIGLGYETHKEHGMDKLHEDSPRRILTSQKRGAEAQRLVLENGNFNTWELIGTAAEIREAQREDIDDDPAAKFKGWKLDCWNALSVDWQSTTQLFDQLPAERRNKKNGSQVLREKLREFLTAQLIEQQPREFDGEASWRLKPQLLP